MSVDREVMASRLKIAAGATPDRTPLPILEGVLMRAGGGGAVSLTGTNMELSATAEFGCDVEEEGECLLPAARVLRALEHGTGRDVEIAEHDRLIRIAGESSDYEFPGDDPSKFPGTRGFAAGGYHVVQARDMLRLISRTAFAATDPSETKMAISGVLAEPGDGTMTFTAISRRGCARQSVPADREGSPSHPKTTVSVPTRALKLLKSNLKADDPPVHCSFTESSAFFRTETAVIWARLVEGRFHRLDDAIPGRILARCTADVEGLMAAVRQASVVTDAVSKAVDFRFTTGELRLSGSAVSGIDRASKARSRVAVEYDGPETCFRLDPSHVLAGLAAMGDQSPVVISIPPTNDNIVMRTADDYLFLVSPMAVPQAAEK